MLTSKLTIICLLFCSYAEANSKLKINYLLLLIRIVYCLTYRYAPILQYNFEKDFMSKHISFVLRINQRSLVEIQLDIARKIVLLHFIYWVYIMRMSQHIYIEFSVQS